MPPRPTSEESGSITGRLVWLCKIKGWTGNKLEVEAGLTRGLGYRYLHGERSPEAAQIRVMAEKLGAFPEWLAWGLLHDGKIFVDEKSSVEEIRDELYAMKDELASMRQEPSKRRRSSGSMKRPIIK